MSDSHLPFKVMINGVEYRPTLPEAIGFRTFSETMKETRKALGWTLEFACTSIGCSKSYLFGMENGVNKPSLEMAHQISKAYDISLKKLAVALEVRQLPPEAVTTASD